MNYCKTHDTPYWNLQYASWTTRTLRPKLRRIHLVHAHTEPLQLTWPRSFIVPGAPAWMDEVKYDLYKMQQDTRELPAA